MQTFSSIKCIQKQIEWYLRNGSNEFKNETYTSAKDLIDRYENLKSNPRISKEELINAQKQLLDALSAHLALISANSLTFLEFLLGEKMNGLSITNISDEGKQCNGDHEDSDDDLGDLRSDRRWFHVDDDRFKLE